MTTSFNDLRHVIDVIGSPASDVKPLLDALSTSIARSYENANNLLDALQTPPAILSAEQAATWNAVKASVKKIATTMNAIST
jgi:hypothetical protein